MQLPLELEDQYVKNVLYNTNLDDLPGEEWKIIEDLENYAISNMGRVKSLERLTPMANGGYRKDGERIIKLSFVKYFNRYLQRTFYHVFCGFSLEGKKFRRSVARLVYYYFIEKFSMDDQHIAISYRDTNSLHLNYNNLELLSISEIHLKKFRKKRASQAKQAVSQYTVYGEHISNFKSIVAASKASGTSPGGIFSVLKKISFTAGGFRWFPDDYIPQENDFLTTKKNKALGSKETLNVSLWEKLGKPDIDQNHPPACVNLSLLNLPEELWKEIPDFEGQYIISNKGRVKRRSGWVHVTRSKIFAREKMMPLRMVNSISKNPHLSVNLRKNGRNVNMSISRLMYYCFVQEFDLNDRSLVIKNLNEPKWDIDPLKLSLITIYSLTHPELPDE
ncbi:NUMOD4 domain-containing protein [Chryseobacterium fluminis]|uniref:NUMOD4 domain-containing protein n=1 Tax=Chryseobacterium fluminis TaxID=2983606 RepID=UPI00224FB592|nr:NUMOD4 domain-containing protein [Chryseobacterium sp. MMS21-Ot14]UZT97993.1 NUMOD4 domain-containing protein [Chryseobacterium sp. MMS21-Ot14]